MENIVKNFFQILCLLFLFLLPNTSYAETIAIPNALVVPKEYQEISQSVAIRIAEELKVCESRYQIVGPEELENLEFLIELDPDRSSTAHQQMREKYDYICTTVVNNIAGVFHIEATIYKTGSGNIVLKKILSKEGSVLVTAELSSLIGKKLAQELLLLASTEQAALLLELPPKDTHEQLLPFEQRKKGYSHLVFYRNFPWLSGSTNTEINDIHNSDYGTNNYTVEIQGYELNLLIDFLNSIYLSFGTAGYSQSFELDDGSYTADDFSIISLHASFGYLYTFHQLFALHTGIGISFLQLEFNDYWYTHGLSYCMESGIGIRAETGIDFFLKDICLSSTLSYTYYDHLSQSELFLSPESFAVACLSIGLGIRF